MDHAASDSRIFADTRGGLRFSTLLLVTLLVVTYALACVWTRYRVIQTGYVLDDLRVEIQSARAERQRLTVALSALKSSESLERHAKALGLAEVSMEQVRNIR